MTAISQATGGIFTDSGLDVDGWQLGNDAGELAVGVWPFYPHVDFGDDDGGTRHVARNPG